MICDSQTQSRSWIKVFGKPDKWCNVKSGEVSSIHVTQKKGRKEEKKK